MTPFHLSEQTRRLALGQPFVLESGETLPAVEIAYRTWGTLAAKGDNAVIVCHALTGSADADIWWGPLFGSGKTLDPRQHFIVCSNVLGGCYGTTGPTQPRANGRLWGGQFPAITIRDQVRLQMRLADHLGIRRIRFVIGGSMGGLQALEWAVLDPERVAMVIAIAASGRHSSWCLAWSEAQRLALTADPLFCNGHYDPLHPPIQGLGAARAIAMVTYRSPQSLGARFGRATGQPVFAADTAAPEGFAVRNWLRFHGTALTKRFDANSYLALLNAMDTHDLSRNRGTYEKVLRTIQQPVLIGSVMTDCLYLPAEQYELARFLPYGKVLGIHSEHGHDGFLIDAAKFEPNIRHFIGHPTFSSCAM